MDHPVCYMYFSKKLDCHQRNYSTCEKETLALLLSLQHFEVYGGSTTTPVKVLSVILKAEMQTLCLGLCEHNVLKTW